MDDNQTIEINKTIRTYVIVGISLIVLTLVGVLGVRRLESTSARIAILLCISLVQAFLSVGYLMHLISEKKFIYTVLVLTVVLFVVLIFVPLLTMSDAVVPSHVP